MSLRWYQSEAIDATWRHLCEAKTNPVIVLPTGAGKSHVIAGLAQKAVAANGRVIVLAHRKELLTQNAEKIRSAGLPVGINSAGLRLRDIDSDVICAGIQSVYNKAAHFGRRHLVLIDESHLVPSHDAGMYRQFLAELAEINRGVFCVGLTATPYRLDSGRIYGKDEIFAAISYEAKIPRLIADGFLCPITSEAAESEIDTSHIAIRGGEFVESAMQQAFDYSELVDAACREILSKTANRKSVLIFSSGIQHAKHIAERIPDAEVVTGETGFLERASTLARFKNRELKYLVNVDVLTTGFDAPCVDAIAVLRATQSAGLFAQICGRGFRLHQEKENCLILDFGENVKRHGPLDSDSYGEISKPAGSGTGEAPEKTCPACDTMQPAGVRDCQDCGFRFPDPGPRHEAKAGNDSILSLPVRRTVEEIRYSRHKKKSGDGPDTLRVDYLCYSGGNVPDTISEWVCFDHEGYARTKAVLWWKARSKAPIPKGVEEALYGCERWVAGASEVTTIQDGKFQRIQSVELEDIPEYEPEPNDNGRRVIADLKAAGIELSLWNSYLKVWGEPSAEQVLLLDRHEAEIIACLQAEALEEAPF